MNIDSWALIEYDRIVADSGEDGITPKDIREQLAASYVMAIADGIIERPQQDDYSDCMVLYDRTVRPERERRRDQIIDDMDYLLASLDNETLLGPDDPVFGRAYKLGTGKDKILGLWTADDWQQAMLTRYDNAAAATAAAALFSERGRRIISLMQRHEVRMTKECFWHN